MSRFPRPLNAHVIAPPHLPPGHRVSLQLVEVLNEDYSDYVGLAGKLTNVEGAVARMRKPLVELKVYMHAFCLPSSLTACNYSWLVTSHALHVARLSFPSRSMARVYNPPPPAAGQAASPARLCEGRAQHVEPGGRPGVPLSERPVAGTASHMPPPNPSCTCQSSCADSGTFSMIR